MLRRRSLHRCVTSVFVVLSLLFSQLALAAYVCPGATDMSAMAEMAVRGEPCEGTDVAQPALCHQHAATPSQSVDPLKVVTASLPTLVFMVVMPAADVAGDAQSMPASAKSEVHPPPDPLFLSTLRLRV